MTKIEFDHCLEAGEFNKSPKTSPKEMNHIGTEIFERPVKKVFILQKNLMTEDQAISGNSGKDMTLRTKLVEQNMKEKALSDESEQSVFNSLDFWYNLSYQKSINVEVSLRNIPDEIENIEYTDAKNFLKSLGGYFLKYLGHKVSEGRVFGDKDCLISMKVWNALFSLKNRDQLGRIKTKKVVVFLQQLEELKEKITTRDWMNYFIEFLYKIDVDMFQKKGKIQGSKRILLYKLLTMLLKRTAELFTQIQSCMKSYNINITSFKIKEIYKSRVIFSFKTDFELGDGKLIEPLKVGIDNKKFNAEVTQVNKQSSKVIIKRENSNQPIRPTIPELETKIETECGNLTHNLQVSKTEPQKIEREMPKRMHGDLISIYDKEKSHYDDNPNLDSESLHLKNFHEECVNYLRNLNLLIMSRYILMNPNRVNSMEILSNKASETPLICKEEEQ